MEIIYHDIDADRLSTCCLNRHIHRQTSLKIQRATATMLSLREDQCARNLDRLECPPI